ncbi:hypothetical protein EDB80DRAFT_718303 [Ilyonectria destructans]|nr:hypothetical protein EDB80DRAFT_718303 [Ilyonectria destructans]
MEKHAHEHFESLRAPDTDAVSDKLRDIRESALYVSQDTIKHATEPQIQFLKTARYWQCCGCHDGWFSVALVDNCPTCLAYRCENCQYTAG